MVWSPMLLAAALLTTPAPEAVLLSFSSPYCGPCRSMEATLERLRQEGYPLEQIDVGQQAELATRMGVDRVPCFILIYRGQEVARKVGVTEHAELVQLFQQAGITAPPSMLNRSLAGEPADRRLETSNRDPATMPWMANPAASPLPPPNTHAAQQRAVYATVRLTVEDVHGHSVGTGTIIDTHGDEALVVTCGHIFRESGGRGPVTVDLFLPDGMKQVPGTVITYDADKTDVGLVSIRPGNAVLPAPVAADDYQVRPGEEVFSIGCDKGASPSVRGSRITAVNKYLGAPNLEVAGQPVDGRSGGGLFSADGQLLGICNAADPTDNEGIFAALEVIHRHLDQIGQRRIYARQRERAADPAPQLAQVLPVPTPPIAPQDVLSRPRGNGSWSGPAGLAEMPPATSATAISAGNEQLEVISIIRPRGNPLAHGQVIVVPLASPELLERLSRESQEDSLQQPAAAASPEAWSPIVRGQSN